MHVIITYKYVNGNESLYYLIGGMLEWPDVRLLKMRPVPLFFPFVRIIKTLVTLQYRVCDTWGPFH